ncbi:hypothetical protein D3C87_2025800 [compost metagenome]
MLWRRFLPEREIVAKAVAKLRLLNAPEMVVITWKSTTLFRFQKRVKTVSKTRLRFVLTAIDKSILALFV